LLSAQDANRTKVVNGTAFQTAEDAEYRTRAIESTSFFFMVTV
jgi:hypothetical protein